MRLATPANMRRTEDKRGCQNPGIFAWSPTTGEECSASSGDYWNQPDNEPLFDLAGEPMILARRVSAVVAS